ncbi:MAG: hypothetical protein HYU65_02465 [Armatimonadetes bacterium]|nr:hypothetical protein [Armatimonadota bacterium]
MAEVSLQTHDQQVIKRIGFAERWLDRAKRQYQDGDVPRGLLTLVLASAEMTHAIRLAHPAISTRRRWVVPVAAAAAATAIVLLALAGRPLWMPAPASSAPAPIVVTLSNRVGTLLELVEAPPDPSAAPVPQHASPQVTRRSVAGVKRSARDTERLAVFATIPVEPVSVRVVQKQVPSPAPAAGPVIPPAGTIVDYSLSDEELIDLVLAAERILRTPLRP